MMAFLAAAPAGLDRWFGWGYALAAYLVILVGFFGYVAYLHVSQTRLRRRLDGLEKELRSRGET